MKKFNVCFILFALLLLGCKSEKGISFCEGVSPNGEKINCGTKFTTGDLTAIVENDKPFETDRINITILEIKKYKSEEVQSFPVTVKPEESSVRIGMSFYNEGQYRVRALDNERKTIAEAEIAIIDTY
jgi:hypothetical protein